MKKGLISKGLCIGIAFATCFCAVRTYGETVINEAFRKQVEKTIDKVETDGPRMINLAKDVKTAGASYMPEILAPVNPDKYQTEERQRLMAGIYLMDLEYATAFEKEKEMLDYGLAMYSLSDKLGFPVPQIENQIRDLMVHIGDPDAEQRFEALGKALDQDDSWKEMLSSPRGMEYIVEGLYACILEGVYITSEVAAQSDYKPEFLKALDAHKSYLKTYAELLDQFTDKPEFASILRKPERLQTIKSLTALLTGPNPTGKKEVEEIRKIVEPVRNEIVR